METGGVQNLNSNWKFRRGEVLDGGYKGLDDTAWKTVELPHDWSVEEPFDLQWASGTGYLPGGMAWYRKHFTLPDTIEGKYLELEFAGVYNNSRVWCNSNYLGKRPYGYSSFAYDISEFVVPGENVIAVCVDHKDIADSRWFTGSGIYRDVTLRITERVHFARHGIFVTTETADLEHADLKIRWKVEGAKAGEEAEVRFSYDGQAFTAGSGMEGETILTIQQPKFWSPEKPVLSKLCAQLYVAGEKQEEQIISYGIRTFQFDAEHGFVLNGNALKLKGVCVHHDAGVLGAAVPKQVWARRLRKFKEMGCNAIRMSHNPPDPKLLDLCDELGFLVMDEAFDEWEGCKNKWWQGHNVYPPKHFGYSEEFPQWHEADLKELVERDRNHPCVILWSIGNEIDYPNDPYCHPSFELMTGNNDANKPEQERRYDPNKPNAKRLARIAEELTAIVKQSDHSRPVTAALAYPELSNETGLSAALDIVGYNYKEHRYPQDHERFPDRVIYGSENSNAPECWQAVTDHDYICGQFLWTGIDFLGEAHGWPVRISQAGNLTLAGFEKPMYYQRKALWTKEPFTYLAVRKAGEPKWQLGEEHWNFEPGEDVEVCCYTNCTKAELYFNGTSYGVQFPELGRCIWKLSFEAGELNVVGRKDKTEVCSGLKTAGTPYALILHPVEETDTQDTKDVVQVEISIVDVKGIPVKNQELKLTAGICGDGKILGMESGSPVDLTPYSEHTRTTFHGQMILYLHRFKPGTVRLKVFSAGQEKLEAELLL